MDVNIHGPSSNGSLDSPVQINAMISCLAKPEEKPTSPLKANPEGPVADPESPCLPPDGLENDAVDPVFSQPARNAEDELDGSVIADEDGGSPVPQDGSPAAGNPGQPSSGRPTDSTADEKDVDPCQAVGAAQSRTASSGFEGGSDPPAPEQTTTDCRPNQPGPAVATPEKVNLDDETEASALIRELQEKGMLEKLVEQYGYQKTKDPATKAKKASAVQTLANENRVRCTYINCQKTFNRQCELK
jgi:hypothetical protein